MVSELTWLFTVAHYCITFAVPIAATGVEGLPPHQLFSFNAATGEEVHGIIYPAKGATPGTKYPTIVYVYGGPRFQVCVCLVRKRNTDCTDAQCFTSCVPV